MPGNFMQLCALACAGDSLKAELQLTASLMEAGSKFKTFRKGVGVEGLKPDLWLPTGLWLSFTPCQAKERTTEWRLGIHPGAQLSVKEENPRLP